MKLLILTNNPDRASFRQRIRVYIPLLEAEGIACEVQTLPSTLLAKWLLLRQAGRFDGVLLHKKGLDVLESWALRRHARKVVYDFDDAIMYKQESPEVTDRRHLQKFERSAKVADLIIAGNRYLAAHAEKLGRCVAVLPTGLDTQAYKLLPVRPNDGRLRLVWIGSSATLPYLEMLLPVLSKLDASLRARVTLRVIADRFPDVKGVPVEQCVWSEAAQYADLAACDIGLSPLPDDKFTRGKCGFKILQYFASGLPVVASPVGINRDLIDECGGGLLAENEEQWTDSIGRLLADAALRKDMGGRGLEYVRRFDVSVLSKRFVDLVKEGGGT